MIGISLKPSSNLVTYGHPFVRQIVPPPKYLQIKTIWHQLLYILVDLLRLLALAPPVTENNVLCHSLLQLTSVTFDTNEASFLGMLQVVAMTLSYLAIDRLLDPGNRVDQLVTPLLHQLDSKHVLGIDRPDDHDPILLQFVDRNPLDPLITERFILNGDTS